MRFFLLIISFLILFSVVSQAEDLYVEVREDSVIIHNTRVQEHCAFSPRIKVQVNNNTVVLVEQDTFPALATCVCYFDYQITLNGLAGGNYTLFLYRQYSADFMNTDSLYFITSTIFSFPSGAAGNLSTQTQSSNCYELSAIEEAKISPAGILTFTNKPNPANPVTNLEYYLPTAGQVRLEIFDTRGRLIRQLVNQYMGLGLHQFSYDTTDLASGHYFSRLIFKQNQIRTQSFTVLK